jgi:hypothetical protein
VQTGERAHVPTVPGSDWSQARSLPRFQDSLPPLHHHEKRWGNCKAKRERNRKESETETNITVLTGTL